MDGENVKGMCRVCLDSDTEMKSIFSVQKFSTNWAQINEVIMICASVTIQKTDGLTDKVCLKCLEALHTTITFKETCERSHAELKGRLLAKQQSSCENGVNTQDQEIIDIDAIDTETPQTEEINNDQDIIDIEAFDTETPATEDINNDLQEPLNQTKEDFIVDLTEDEDMPTTNDGSNKNETEEVSTVTDNNISNLTHYKESDEDVSGDTDNNISNLSQVEADEDMFTDTETPNGTIENISNDIPQVLTSKEANEEDVSTDTETPNGAIGNINNDIPQILIEQNNSKLSLKFFRCISCKACFTEHSEFMKHKSTHVKDSYSCTVKDCNRVFRKKSHLLRHRQVHKAQIQEKPEPKENIDSDLANTVEEELLVDLAESKFYKCKVCKEQFITRLLLFKHKRMHCLLKCETCSALFADKLEYRKHTRTHFKQHKCQKCYMNFTRISSLQRHELLHENRHPLECVQCSQRFNYFEQLVKHMDSHVKNLIPCETCGKDFQNKNNLMRHRAVHTGIYPFHCSDCGRGYYAGSQLKKHRHDKH